MTILEKDYLKNELAEISFLAKNKILGYIKKYEQLGRLSAEESQVVMKKKNIPKKMENVFHLFRILAQLRDKRKKMVLMSNHFYDLYAKRIVKEYRINLELVYNAFPQELFLSKEKVINLESELKARKDGISFGHLKDEDFVFSGQAARTIIKILHKKSEKIGAKIFGLVACPGGKVKGRVAVVLWESHFSKFEDKDVLVACMTRPEYITLMRKASAIITDEGGLTSHAAIVSRELGIPCIVGTKIATQVLKDGDLVEVDADHGLVKILKS